MGLGCVGVVAVVGGRVALLVGVVMIGESGVVERWCVFVCVRVLPRSST